MYLMLNSVVKFILVLILIYNTYKHILIITALYDKAVHITIVIYTPVFLSPYLLK